MMLKPLSSSDTFGIACHYFPPASEEPGAGRTQCGRWRNAVQCYPQLSTPADRPLLDQPVAAAKMVFPAWLSYSENSQLSWYVLYTQQHHRMFKWCIVKASGFSKVASRDPQGSKSSFTGLYVSGAKDQCIYYGIYISSFLFSMSFFSPPSPFSHTVSYFFYLTFFCYSSTTF